MKNLIKSFSIYLALIAVVPKAALAYEADASPTAKVEVLNCSLTIARWYQGHIYKIIADIPSQTVYLGESSSPNDIQPILWFPNLRNNNPLKHVGVFASLTANPVTGEKVVDVGFYKVKTIFPRDTVPKKSWRMGENSPRYMLPVFSKKVNGLENIEINYEEDIEPLNLNITGNLNYKYIDLKCEHMGTLEN